MPPLSPAARRHQQDFDAAASEFDVPRALLEAIAWIETRWQPQARSGHGMPAVHGIMGLRDDPHFGRSLRLASALAGLPSTRLALDTRSCIRGAGALLAHYGGGKTRASPLEEWEAALARYSGIRQREIAHIYTYDLYMAIRAGRQGRDYQVTRHAVDLERTYGAARLALLSAPALTLAADYPAARWLPAASCNYSSRLLPVSHVTVHTTQGSYAGAISWFRNCSAGASAHYLVRSSDGQITQMVRERDKAWHAGSANGHSVGIEHEGFVENPDAWYSGPMLAASAQLARTILAARGAPPRVYDGSRGWDAVLPDADYNVTGHVNHAGQTHTDPGAGWNWRRYKELVELTAPGATAMVGTIPSTAPSMSLSPYLGLYPALGQRTYLHPSCHLIGDVRIGDDSSVWCNAVLRGDVNHIHIGRASNIQDFTMGHVAHRNEHKPLGAPLVIGDYVTIGHNVILHGCRIGDECLVGMGTIVMDDVVIQPRVMVGAGSLVAPGKVLESGYLYVGRPARRVRALSDKELAHLRYSAEHYVRVKDNYLLGPATP